MANAGYQLELGQNNPYEQATYAEEGHADHYHHTPNEYTEHLTGSQPQDSTYGQPTTHANAGHPTQQANAGYSTQQANAGYSTQHSNPLSNQDFLTRVEGVRSDIRQLTSNVSEIGTLHQRALNSTDGSQAPQLEQIVSQTSVLNTRIKDQIKFLETDSVKSGQPTTKKSQVRTLKSHFQDQLQQYQQEERSYRSRYEEQIARQYKIINPEASEAEVREAATADWANEGVFQTAVWPQQNCPQHSGYD